MICDHVRCFLRDADQHEAAVLIGDAGAHAGHLFPVLHLILGTLHREQHVAGLHLRAGHRVTGTVDHPARAVVETVEVRVSDNNGGVRASQTVKL